MSFNLNEPDRRRDRNVKFCKFGMFLHSTVINIPSAKLLSLTDTFSTAIIINNIDLVMNVQELLQLQMRISFPFLRYNHLRTSLLIMRTRSFFTLLYVGGA